ncbi:MAG: HAD-IA family hydrolase [Candidatus Poribacteria bacterium]|nr:HAD-IA family hydrolase [Candidatus Poribacteria bacterium]
MIKAVFLDFYKTLYFHRWTLEENLRRIAARYRVEINWERFETAQESLFADTAVFDPATYSLMESLITTIKRECEFIRELGIQEHAEQIAWELLQSGHFLFAANSGTLYSDVVPTLQHLRDAGFKLAVVSNWESPLDPLTERLGIADYFDAVVASHDVRVRSEKPDPHIFNYALAAVGTSTEEVVHVGDTYEADIVGAQNVGIRPILLDRDNTQAGRWGETIQSLAELPELLKADTS